MSRPIAITSQTLQRYQRRTSLPTLTLVVHRPLWQRLVLRYAGLYVAAAVLGVSIGVVVGLVPALIGN